MTSAAHAHIHTMYMHMCMYMYMAKPLPLNHMCWVPLQAEEAVRQAGFQRAVLFRPGMLDRGAAARPIERVRVIKNVAFMY